jgi:hypothetical protein
VGESGCHEGARTLIQKALRQGFYWPTMSKEASTLVQACEACQRYASNITRPPAELTPMMSAWPFTQWGIDLIGPLPKVKLQRRFVVVAIDYFSKWIEARALSVTTTKHIKAFIKEQILCRYGVPRVLISDNGPQFASDEMRMFTLEHGIQHRFGSVHHAQTNGQVESANKIVLDGLKRRLYAAKGSWVDQLDSVLWATRTTPKRSTGETPFGMVYGSEAVSPTEIKATSYRVETFSESQNDLERRMDLDLAESKRRASEAVQEKMKLATARYYNKKVNRR